MGGADFSDDLFKEVYDNELPIIAADGGANFLAENKRYGIPYNSVHGPNNIEGIILPEILTVKTLLNTIKQVKE